MLSILFVIVIRTTSALLITSDSRVSTRNLTCQHGSSSATLFFDCEACLVISRNYAIQSTLSIAGSGPSGINYVCLQVNDIEAYHENLVRECQNFPRQTLNGYDDFCVASPYNKFRGSYRACLCATNACNFNYNECVRQASPYWDRQPAIFGNTIARLNDRIKCYRPYEDYESHVTSYPMSLCSSNDDECKNFLFDHGVLCMISVDRTNQLLRQTLPPSIYVARLMQLKTKFCRSFTWTSKSIYFSKCQQGETICMCAIDGCDKDLQTCQTSRATHHHHHLFVYVLLLLININLCVSINDVSCFA
jgi:hypothetical protein